MLNDRLVSRLRSIDWDFAGSASESPFSSIHWHPCRFASQVPAALIGLLTRVGDLVIDPFVGSGTTVVEAQRLRRPSIGVDLNPVACLIARAKTLDCHADAIGRLSQALACEARELLRGQPRLAQVQRRETAIPESVQGAKWYTPRTLRHLARLWNWIQRLDGAGKVLAEASFSAILLTVCRETRHWGYVCDNTQPLDDREGDVLREFTSALDRFAAAYADRDAELRAAGSPGVVGARIIAGDAGEALRQIKDGSAKLILTSPPYYGVCDYIKCQRLSMEWFGLPIEPNRLSEIGARSKRHRKTAAQEYLEEMRVVLREARRCIGRAGSMVLVIGESAKRTPVLPEILRVAVEESWRPVVDLERQVSAQRRQTPSITTEHLMVFDRK